LAVDWARLGATMTLCLAAALVRDLVCRAEEEEEA
jgi:hypothetical protein